MKQSRSERELIVDSFAGGGGASLGISWALGRGPDVAINHDAGAIRMHAANHPETRHYTEDVWKIRPQDVTAGRAVGLLWASPDCKHFSRAKGGKPVEKKIRSLAWVVIRWAKESRPRLIILENVREFADWGPLTEDNRPCPKRKGITFRRWVGQLRSLGYAVEWRVLDAADYGAPTHRRRLFLIARCDGRPISWPEPTHGDPERIGKGLFDQDLKPWRTAAECIDWSLPCPSIFLSREEAKAWAKANGVAAPQRPLREKTMRRIAMGIKRYVLDNPNPFLVVCNHGGEEFRGQAISDPMPTVTASRDAHGIIAPCIVGVGGRAGQSPATAANAPVGTVTAKNDRALVTPLLARIGQTGGNGKYANAVNEPLTTVVSKAEHLLVSPLLTRYNTETSEGDTRSHSLNAPIGTIVSENRFSLVAAFLAKHYGGAVGQQLPAPLGTVTAKDHHSVVAANLVRFNHDDAGVDVASPMPTVMPSGHAALVYSFLTKYFGTAVGVEISSPLPTITPKDRFGLVMVNVQGEPHVIVDIGMRMLRPRELARGQGFPDSYILTGSNTEQVDKIGNSVAPAMARALVEANYVPEERGEVA